MDLDRRRFFALSALGLAAGEAAAAPSPNPPPSLWARGVSASELKIEPDSSEDQSRALQRAIEQTAAARVPLMLPPGVFRAGDLRLPGGARLIGCPGASRMLLSEGASLIAAKDADHVLLSGLILDGGSRPLAGRGLLHFSGGRGVRIEQCEIMNSAGDAVALEGVEGEVTRNTISAVEGAGIFSLDASGLTIGQNTIRDAGNNGILVWRSKAGDDGTLIIDNRIENVSAKRGGSGQNGNGINVFRAGNVIVRGNRIRNAAFSAVRCNAASQVQVVANNCANIGEVALYAEFDFEGAVINGNTVDGAAIGVAVTNFKEGGRLATVQGNVLRNITKERPPGTDPNDGFGIGIGVEADTAVSGNVIENAGRIGITIGNGPYLRDVTATGNVIRSTPIGIAVTVVKGAGAAVISQNLITGARRGAIVGMEWQNVVTADLAMVAPGAYPHLTITGNQVR